MSYKNIDELMDYLRGLGIEIQGDIQKEQLRNMGYFHGYKGYRFYKVVNRRIPYKNFEEIYQTVRYDSALKSLIYEKIMFIETAVKNRAMESIIEIADSEEWEIIFDHLIESYRNCPDTYNCKQKKAAQQKKLELQNRVQKMVLGAYKQNNPQITHFFMDTNPKHHGIPMWALIEVMTMGNFGYLLSCLNLDARTDIARKMNLYTSMDTNRDFLYRYIWLLKDLRNAVAHNKVIFDTRFSRSELSKAMRKYVCNQTKVPFINFTTIGDYIILISFFLKLLRVPKGEIKKFIQQFVLITRAYKNQVSPNIADVIIQHGIVERMNLLENNI
ncbi:Abi family protein [Megasphaera elsdenii]|uniref:Abi family protein n=1 Tax=Megasphaera elsdenii TaxID=907 RepID=UPI0040359A2E